MKQVKKVLRRLRKHWKPIGYMILLIAIIMVGLLFGRHMHAKRVKAPSQSLAALHASLNQVYLLQSNLSEVDGSSDRSPEEIIRLMDTLKQNLDQSQQLLDQHKKELKPDIEKKVAEALGIQKQLFANYQARYKVIGKAVAYNPSLDMGSLDPSKDTQSLSDRAVAAQTNLQKIAGTSTTNFQLSQTSIEDLNASANCFGLLASNLKTEKPNVIKETRSRCISNYVTTRTQLVTELSVVYKDNLRATDLLLTP